MTGDGYTFRVTTKGCNVPLNPFECGDLIHQAVVSRRVVRDLARELRKRKKTKRTKPISDGDSDDTLLRKPVTPVRGPA